MSSSQAGTAEQARVRSTGDAVRHPLDPLTLDEIQCACDTLRQKQSLGASARFITVELREPPKSEVLGFQTGAPIVRRAFANVLDAATGRSFEALVDVTSGSVLFWTEMPTGPEHGQPPIYIDEFRRADKVVKAYKPWRQVLRRRGLSEADIDRVQIDPISPGFFDHEAYSGKRIVRAVAYYRESMTDNSYAHPIEGLVAIVDTVAEEVISMHDDGRDVPIWRRKHNYDQASLGSPRADLRPLSIHQPEGPSFHVDGWRVSWQGWDFRVGFTPREGLVLHQLGFKDGGRIRPVIYRASVTEMAVPYADPTPQHFAKCAFDAGEFGLGKLANALELGCDCLGVIHYFDVPAYDDFGQARVMKNAVCMHEEDFGILWKHNDFGNGINQVRRSRRLVISFFTTVGNYDYGFYWYLYQDGTIQLEAKLTGIVQTASLMPGEKYRWGGMLTENLGGPSHQHFFNARLHMMVDGETNSVTEHEFQPVPLGEENPYGNVFKVTNRTFATEGEAARDACGQTGRFWKVINPQSVNPMGAPAGYKLIAMPAPTLLASEGSAVRRRAGFATKHVWVTPYDPAERFASGDYPNLHKGECGLPVYIKQNRPIENTDLVLWHSFGHTHVCKPEDFPIMPVEYAGFTLKPNNFFHQNVTMDLPSVADVNSQRSGAATASCCAAPHPASNSVADIPQPAPSPSH